MLHGMHCDPSNERRKQTNMRDIFITVNEYSIALSGTAKGKNVTVKRGIRHEHIVTFHEEIHEGSNGEEKKLVKIHIVNNLNEERFIYSTDPYEEIDRLVNFRTVRKSKKSTK